VDVAEKIEVRKEIFRDYLAFFSDLVTFATHCSGRPAKAVIFTSGNTPLQRQGKRKKERRQGTLEARLIVRALRH
jgi:hypothetical protein